MPDEKQVERYRKTRRLRDQSPEPEERDAAARVCTRMERDYPGIAAAADANAAAERAREQARPQPPPPGYPYPQPGGFQPSGQAIPPNPYIRTGAPIPPGVPTPGVPIPGLPPTGQMIYDFIHQAWGTVRAIQLAEEIAGAVAIKTRTNSRGEVKVLITLTPEQIGQLRAQNGGLDDLAFAVGERAGMLLLDALQS